jgi:NAD(P)H-flavin reductase
MLGRFQLIVKRYAVPEGKDVAAGLMSNYIFSREIGSEVQFKHIKFNVKIPYPFTQYKTISMISGGTGIAPMYQALHSLLNTEGD